MKRIIYITILALMLLAACSKPSEAPASTPEQYDRYIFFSHSVETKATLVEKATDMNGKDFGVVGFKYDENTDWATFSTTEVNGNLPKPNVFYDDDNTTLVDVETVGVVGTTAEYAPLQGWSNNKKYAFFAFYPHNMELVNLDGDTPYSGGIPAIKYTLNTPAEGPADGSLIKASMEDVMTAPALIDKFWKSSAAGGNNINNGVVNFEFSHRLSCLGISLKKTSESNIYITSLTLTISGIQNSSTLIPLDMDSQMPDEKELPETQFSITLDDNEKAIEEKEKEIHDKLIFVPQSEAISINITVKYTRQYPSSEEYVDETTITGVTTDLAEGYKHILRLNFADYNVNVTVIKNDWENKVIEYDFI